MAVENVLFAVFLCTITLVGAQILDLNSTKSLNVTENVRDKSFITECSLPNDTVGFCVHISQCKYLWDLLNDTSQHDYVKNQSCSSEAHNALVCCDLNRIILKSNTKKIENKANTNEVSWPTNCGKSIFTPSRIFGGENAELGEFPWMVRLSHTDQNGYDTISCAGFIIHRKFMVTAAHCLKPVVLKILGNVNLVIVGEHDTTTNPDCDRKNNGTKCAPEIKKFEVRKIIVHPEYDMNSRSQQNDIALIKIKDAVKFDDYVLSICLPDESSLNQTMYTLTGWGKTETYEKSTTKLKVEVQSSDFEKCKQKYNVLNVDLNSNYQLCAGGEEGRDSCAGDSGGPIMYFSGSRWHAAGIVSFGLSCGRKNWPAVYTNLYSYKDWITETIKNNTLKQK